MMKDLMAVLDGYQDIAQLKKLVVEFARSFPMSGFEPSALEATATI